jgi:hypothetical protein
MVQLHLRKFDIASIASDRTVVLIGKRDTGKSFLIRDILFHHRDLPVGTVISPTEMANHFFGTMVPPLFIHETYTPKVIENVVRRQKLLMTDIERRTAAEGSCDIDPRAFLILDDCLYDKSWINDVNIRYLFMNGRHIKTMFLLTMQSPLGIPPNLRTNIDYVFILRENLISNRKRIYENYAGMLGSFDIFCQVMDQCTENFECLVIHNGAKSNRIEDQVFWYKAEQRPNFKIGAKQFWELSAQMCAPGGEDEDAEMYDADLVHKKKGPRIQVRKKPPPERSW